MDLQEVTAALVDGARDALGNDLLGVYLVGSHALGAADEHSDVDFVAITADRLSPGQQASLEELHATLPDRAAYGADHLEGSYAPAGDLRSPMTVGRAWPYVDHGSRALGRSAQDNTAHARWVLRERGIPLLGPSAVTYVAAVDPAALRAEMVGVARTRAEAVEEYPEQLANGWFQPHLVVTLCRVLYTAHHGEVTSKADAAAWALGAVGVEHQPLIRQALEDRPAPWRRALEHADPALAAPTRAFAWEVHRLVGAEVLRLATG